MLPTTVPSVELCICSPVTRTDGESERVRERERERGRGRVSERASGSTRLGSGGWTQSQAAAAGRPAGPGPLSPGRGARPPSAPPPPPPPLPSPDLTCKHAQPRPPDSTNQNGRGCRGPGDIWRRWRPGRVAGRSAPAEVCLAGAATGRSDRCAGQRRIRRRRLPTLYRCTSRTLSAVKYILILTILYPSFW